MSEYSDWFVLNSKPLKDTKGPYVNDAKVGDMFKCISHGAKGLTFKVVSDEEPIMENGRMKFPLPLPYEYMDGPRKGKQCCLYCWTEIEFIDNL